MTGGKGLTKHGQQILSHRFHNQILQQDLQMLPGVTGDHLAAQVLVHGKVLAVQDLAMHGQVTRSIRRRIHGPGETGTGSSRSHLGFKGASHLQKTLILHHQLLH